MRKVPFSQNCFQALAMLVIASTTQLVFAQSTIEELIARENVGRIFFSDQQRGVMEARRQNVADFDPSGIERPSFSAPLEAPRLVLRSVIKTVEDEVSGEEAYERGIDLRFDGIIGKTGDRRVLIDSQVVDQEQLESLQSDLGLELVVSDDNDVTAEDKLFKQKVSFTRGDVLRSDGTLDKPGTQGRFIIVKRQ